MAARANKAALEAAHDGPDYGAALSIIEGRIANAKSAQSKASGEAGQAWASIEKMGIHKAGAQAAAKVIAMEDEDDRQDFLRSFAKLLEVADVSIIADMVDIAEGKVEPVVPVKVAPVTDPAPEGGADPAGDDGGDDAPEIEAKAGQDDDPPVERPARKAGRPRLSVVEAREAAQKHLGGGSPPPVPDALH